MRSETSFRQLSLFTRIELQLMRPKRGAQEVSGERGRRSAGNVDESGRASSCVRTSARASAPRPCNCFLFFTFILFNLKRVSFFLFVSLRLLFSFLFPSFQRFFPFSVPKSLGARSPRNLLCGTIRLRTYTTPPSPPRRIRPYSRVRGNPLAFLGVDVARIALLSAEGNSSACTDFSAPNSDLGPDIDLPSMLLAFSVVRRLRGAEEPFASFCDRNEFLDVCVGAANETELEDAADQTPRSAAGAAKRRCIAECR